MSFVVKNYKNGDTLYANDLNNLVSGVSENASVIAQKANTADVYTTQQVDELVNTKANSSNVYTIEQTDKLLADKANIANVYTKQEVDEKLSAVYHYKGSVATVEELPETAEVGDVYNVEDTGDNYAWNGTAWDKLAGTADLSNYLTVDAAAELYLTQSNAASQYATKDELQTSLSEKQPVGDYATTTQLEASLSTKLDSETATDTFATKDELEAGLNQKQPVGDYPKYQNFSAGSTTDRRKTIQLNNFDSISGLMTDGSTGVNLVMVSKWNKADFGSTQLPFNINSKDGIVQINDTLTVVDNKQLEAAIADFTTSSDVNALITAAAADLATKEELNSTTSTLTTQLTAAINEKANTSDVYMKSAADTKFASKSEIPNALPNPNALTIKYNGATAFTYDGSTAETGNFIVNLDTIPVSEEDTSSAKEYIDNLQVKAVYNLGNFASSGAAEAAAAARGISDNKDYSVLVYTVNGTQNGQIINNVDTQRTVQFLYWEGKRYTRTITFDEEAHASAWASDDRYVALPNRAVMPTLFSLTTSADSDTVKTALTSPLSNEAITLDDLNRCLQLGYTLREYSMQTGSVFVGFNGNAFTLTYVGFANPVQDPAIMSIAINITEDGVYSVTRNATKGIALTSANIASNKVISNLTSTSLDSESAIAVLQDQIKALQDQVQQLKTPVVEPVELTQEAAAVSEPEKDVSFVGAIDSYVATITAKSIQSSNAIIDSGRLSATAEGGDVSIKNLSTLGTLAKSTANAGLSVNTDEYVNITSSNWQQTGYNGIEVGLSSTPKSVIIDNIDFVAKMDNNAISIFDWQDNAVITISNCYFADVSNPLRISNRSNKPATINIINCTVDSWTSGEYAGFICMQDYTSGSAEAAQTANQFGKLTINFVNVTGPDGVKIVGTAKDLVENHQIYLYTEWEGVVDYSEATAARFPTVTAK